MGALKTTKPQNFSPQKFQAIIMISFAVEHNENSYNTAFELCHQKLSRFSHALNTQNCSGWQ